MLPFINLFGKELPSYWLMSIIGAVAVAVFVLIRRKKIDLITEDLIHIVLMGIVGAIIGAKALYIVTILPVIVDNLGKLINNLELFRDILTQGYVFYGGLFGALIAIWLYCRKYSVNFKAASMLFAGAIPLFHVFGRIGCFCAGCCYGIEASWGVVFSKSLGAPNGVRLIPTQLFESASNLLIFVTVISFQRFSKHPERSLMLYLVSYAVCRFILEFFRGDEIRGHLFGLSTSQWISGGIILFYLVQTIIRKANNTKNNGLEL